MTTPLPFFAIIPELLPRNVAGGAIALVNSFGALGGFLGAYGVGYLNGLTGNPAASYIAMGGSLLAAAVLTLFVRPATEKAPGRQAAVSPRAEGYDVSNRHASTAHDS
ncbi:MAG TPA: hypothetical protein VFJ08_04415 [Salinisphaera sp.]|nr:hypothetical protein [Salinisphaera sp.]HET7313583.1 hypothetical protein [Salinisphaera sp.]